MARSAGLVRAAIAEPIDLDAFRFAITPSIGIALTPDHGSSAELRISHADAAMDRAKQSRTPYEFFEPRPGFGHATESQSDARHNIPSLTNLETPP